MYNVVVAAKTTSLPAATRHGPTCLFLDQLASLLIDREVWTVGI